MFELIQQIRSLVEDVKAGDWTDAGRSVADLLRQACDLIDSWSGGAVMAADPAADADYDAAVAELEGCCAHPPVAAADPVKMDPATILLIIKSAMELLKFLRERRKPQP